jgi:hypothetical protein
MCSAGSFRRIIPGAQAPAFVSAGAGLAAAYWLDLGLSGLFAVIAFGFCIYAALTALAVVRISPPATPSAQ